MIYQDAVVYDWPNINAKTLEIGGEKDGATPDFPARAKKACATVPNCQLLLFPNVGHVPNFESPEMFHGEAVGVPRAVVLLPATVPVRIDRFELTAVEHPPVKLVKSLGLNSWNPSHACPDRSPKRLACTYPCAIKPRCAVFPRRERIVRRAW